MASAMIWMPSAVLLGTDLVHPAPGLFQRMGEGIYFREYESGRISPHSDPAFQGETNMTVRLLSVPLSYNISQAPCCFILLFWYAQLINGIVADPVNP